MRNINQKVIVKLSFFATINIFLLFPLGVFSQEISERNYLNLDSCLWKNYEMEIQKTSEYLSKNPNMKDSLTIVYENILNSTLEKNRKLAIQFATVPSGLQRVFMCRLTISKDTLRSILKRLPTELKSSLYYKSILLYINSNQIKEGDNFYDFNATTSTGNPFRLSSLIGKKILLLYGGLDCIGKDGRSYLNRLFEKASHHNFEIVVYCLSDNLENLKKVQETYHCNFVLVSDFQLDQSPFKIVYGAQETPTCFFINTNGKIIMKTEGLNDQLINKLVDLDN
ncbi:peroxiredoxin family protein [Rhizosphaericola mali]|uniref:Redoxin domain-containing protein n=1 Tax=Rhizosphaericola mali TaxID=2545455 RepID=A0A5P2G748_9BACT|nr:redoxin domain-containing protein [Rhizosphaericola mali]QES87341.1 redoxin domain-containing protein [Rhizosphaericola mali]